MSKPETISISLFEQYSEEQQPAFTDSYVSYTYHRLIGVTGLYPTIKKEDDLVEYVFDVSYVKNTDKIKSDLKELFSHIKTDFIKETSRQLLVSISFTDLLTPIYSVFLLSRNKQVIESPDKKQSLLYFSDNMQPLMHLDEDKALLYANGIAKQVKLQFSMIPEDKPSFMFRFFEEVLMSKEGFKFELRSILNWKLQNFKICK